MATTSGFRFVENPHSPSDIAAALADMAEPHLVRIPAGINNKSDLLTTLASALEFPAYFGRNWDAFEECLGDLSWLTGKVVLLHEDLPLATSPEEQAIYLEILFEAVRSGNRLYVVFPRRFARLITEAECSGV